MAGCAFVVCMGCQAQGDDGSIERVVAKWNTRADLLTAAQARAEQAETEVKRLLGVVGTSGSRSRSRPHSPHHNNRTKSMTIAKTLKEKRKEQEDRNTALVQSIAQHDEKLAASARVLLCVTYTSRKD
jgi:hypothetical protein